MLDKAKKAGQVQTIVAVSKWRVKKFYNIEPRSLFNDDNFVKYFEQFHFCQIKKLKNRENGWASKLCRCVHHLSVMSLSADPISR